MAITLRGNSIRLVQIYKEALDLRSLYQGDMIKALTVLAEKYSVGNDTDIEDAEIAEVLLKLEEERKKNYKHHQCCHCCPS
jgi:hypothetical protein